MARNKHPEETVNRILDVAVELFMTRGYDHTTMQDIVDNLGGLTKGAVYHHFKSKEEIFEAAMDRMMAPSVARLEDILSDRSLSGLEKVQRLYDEPTNGSQTEFFQRSSPSCDPVQNARLLGMEYRDVFEVSAHRFLQPAIEQGMADGSIETEYPRELAEAMSLLGNLWCVPLFYPGTPDELRRRAEFMQLFVRRMGLPIDFGNLSDQAMGFAGAEEGEGAVENAANLNDMTDSGTAGDNACASVGLAEDADRNVYGTAAPPSKA